MLTDILYSGYCRQVSLFLYLKDMKIKSSHDVLTDDSKLSAQPAVEQTEPRFVL